MRKGKLCGQVSFILLTRLREDPKKFVPSPIPSTCPKVEAAYAGANENKLISIKSGCVDSSVHMRVMYFISHSGDLI